jgi:pre-mRNA-splicing helicase BRR2
VVDTPEESHNAMDVAQKTEVPKTATLAPGSTVQPKKTVDLESMAFSQGGHLMTNKKCKLPDGSFKRAKKGYEEIHVPARKQKPVVEGEFVPVTSLPAGTGKSACYLRVTCGHLRTMGACKLRAKSYICGHLRAG